MKALLDSELVSVNVEDLIIRANKDALSSFYPQAIKKVLEAIIAEDFNLNRVRLWIWPNDHSYMLNNRRYSKARIRNRTKHNICGVIIDSLSIDEEEDKKEFLIAQKLNELRELHIPNFIYYYSVINGAKPIYNPENGEIYCWFNDPINALGCCNYTLIEDLSDISKSFNSVLESLSSFNQISSLYIQALLSLAAANVRYSFTHNSIHPSRIIIRKIEERDNNTIDYIDFDISVKVFSDIFIFTDFKASTCGELEKPIIYDIYNLSSSFISCIEDKSNITVSGRQFRKMVNEILESCQLPQWYILNIKNNYIDENEILPKEALNIRYSDIVNILREIMSKYQLDNVLMSIKPNRKSGVVSDELIPVKVYDDDEFLSKCYKETYSFTDEDQTKYYKSLHFKVVDKIKNELESEYSIITQLTKSVVTAKTIMSKEELDRYCSLYIRLFISLLKQKIRIDELDLALYTSSKLIKDIANNNLENYINEHYSRLRRIMGELSELYENSRYVFKWQYQDVVDRIWYILSKKSLKTK